MSKHTVFFIPLRIWFYCLWDFLRSWLRYKYKQKFSEIPAEPEIKRELSETFPDTAHKLFQVRQQYNYVQTPITKVSGEKSSFKNYMCLLFAFWNAAVREEIGKTLKFLLLICYLVSPAEELDHVSDKLQEKAKMPGTFQLKNCKTSNFYFTNCHNP